MQCSKPAATKAAIGGMIDTTRSMFERSLKHIHTAKHTSALHMIPRVSAGIKANEVFAFAVLSAVSPTAPPPNVYCVVWNISAAVAIAPTKLPANEITQLSRSARVVTFRLAQP